MRTNADMTLYKRTSGTNGATYTRHLVFGVNWQDRKTAAQLQAQYARGLVTEDVAKVYIPFASLGNEIAPCKGDIAIRGIDDGKNDTGYSETQILKGIDAGKILFVAKNDNGAPHMQHYELEVKR